MQWTISTPAGDRVVTLLGYWLPPPVVLVAPAASDADDESQRQQSLQFIAADLPTAFVSALPTSLAPEINPVARDHIVTDTAFAGLPQDKKTALLDLLAADKSDIVVVSTPSTTDPELNAVLAQAAGSSVGVTRRTVRIGVPFTAPTASAYHKDILPGLLRAYADDTQGFSQPSIIGGGVPVSTTADSDRVPVAVQWTLQSGKRIVTLLGYSRPGELAICELAAQIAHNLSPVAAAFL